MSRARALMAAYVDYQHRLAVLSGINPCPARWPGDPLGGTGCDLTVDHPNTPHRHRMEGTPVVVTW